MAILKKSQKVLKFRTPATLWGAMWREGLPTGNGTIGASVLGGAGFDTVTINHNDLWWHGKTGVLPDVSDKLRATKTAIQNENCIDAQNVLVNAFIAKSYRPQPSYPLPVCDLHKDSIVSTRNKQVSFKASIFIFKCYINFPIFHIN